LREYAGYIYDLVVKKLHFFSRRKLNESQAVDFLEEFRKNHQTKFDKMEKKMED
jgi:hypothetical protein